MDPEPEMARYAPPAQARVSWALLALCALVGMIVGAAVYLVLDLLGFASAILVALALVPLYGWGVGRRAQSGWLVPAYAAVFAAAAGFTVLAYAVVTHVPTGRLDQYVGAHALLSVAMTGSLFVVALSTAFIARWRRR